MRISNVNPYTFMPDIKNKNEMNKSINEPLLKTEQTKENTIQQEQEDAAIAELSEFVEERKRFLEELEMSKEQIEASKDEWINLGKMLEIARRISRGDRVPALDEKKLMEFDKKIYMQSKMAGMVARNKNPEEHESLFEDEEKADEKKIREAVGEAGVSVSVEMTQTESSGDTAADVSAE